MYYTQTLPSSPKARLLLLTSATCPFSGVHKSEKKKKRLLPHNSGSTSRVASLCALESKPVARQTSAHQLHHVGGGGEPNIPAHTQKQPRHPPRHVATHPISAPGARGQASRRGAKSEENRRSTGGQETGGLGPFSRSLAADSRNQSRENGQFQTRRHCRASAAPPAAVAVCEGINERRLCRDLLPHSSSRPHSMNAARRPPPRKR